ADVVQEFVEQIAMVRSLPQVMVGIDDGQVGLEDGLGRPLGKPGQVGRVDAPELRRPAHAAPRISAAQRSSSGSTASNLAAGRLKSTRATPASRQRLIASMSSATPNTVTGMLEGSRPAAAAILRNSGSSASTSP